MKDSCLSVGVVGVVAGDGWCLRVDIGEQDIFKLIEINLCYHETLVK